MEVLALPGESAFTASEAQKIKHRINRSGPLKASRVFGNWVYYAHIKVDKTVVLPTLQGLLPLTNSASQETLTHIGYSQTYHVAPRGISPWSSKATSIAQVCGLQDQVFRIERARAVTIEFDQPLEGESIPFSSAIHDRMTETISLREPDFALMFAEGQPLPLEVVDIFAPGESPLAVLKDYSLGRGLALDHSEMEYLVQVFSQLRRPPQ